MYARLGFFPLEGSPFTFVRDSDETMLFHDPIHDTDEFLWIVVLRDIRRTETLYPEIAGLADRFKNLLVDVFVSEHMQR